MPNSAGFMKAFFLAIVSTLALAGPPAAIVEKPIKEFVKLSPQQKQLLRQTFIRGSSYNLGYSLTAIAMKESDSGKYQLGVNSATSFDCGPFQANVSVVLRRLGRTNSYYSRSEICTKLISNYDYAFTEAVFALQFWHKHSEGDWRKTWAHYHCGYKISSDRCRSYSRTIKANINLLKRVGY